MKLAFNALVMALVLVSSSLIICAADTSDGAGLTNAATDASGTNTNAPVTVTKNFTNTVGMAMIEVGNKIWAGKYEVTQAQYQKLIGSNPSAFIGTNLPVDTISWNDAVAFCAKLTASEISKKKLPATFYYTLPTEDEWQTIMADAALTDAITSLNGQRRLSTSPVGTLGPNSYGLYDTLGNVMEFCLSDSTQPFRYLKGGCWQDYVDINLRPAFRHYCPPDDRQNTYGFRCLLKSK